MKEAGLSVLPAPMEELENSKVRQTGLKGINFFLYICLKIAENNAVFSMLEMLSAQFAPNGVFSAAVSLVKL